MSNPENQLDLAAVRKRLAGASGREYWRSLDDLAATPEFHDMLDREFPRQALGWSDDEIRSKGGAISSGDGRLAGAGRAYRLHATTIEHIVPYVRQPEELIPGRPLFFATAATLGGVANGILAESHEGRPTKIEGNPEHPPPWAPAILSRRRRYCSCTIRTARRPPACRAKSAAGESSSARSADCWRRRKVRTARESGFSPRP